MQFIRLITQGPHHAFFNMALDEAISEAVRQKLSPPTLRLYQWDRPSVTIGYFQKISEINTEYCIEKGYPVVRRATGGRAVLHDGELTYSFSSPKKIFSFNGSLLENYAVISNALIKGLNLIGINAGISFVKKRNSSHRNPACFKSVSYGEVTVDGKKIIGSAQKKYSDGFLQQGSIMLSFKAGELSNVLNGSNEEDFRDIGSISDAGREVTFNELKKPIKEAFEKELSVKLVSGDPSRFELSLAGEFEKKKYSATEWNFLR
jgi:lipoate-protein ligase A